MTEIKFCLNWEWLLFGFVFDDSLFGIHLGPLAIVISRVED